MPARKPARSPHRKRRWLLAVILLISAFVAWRNGIFSIWPRRQMRHALQANQLDRAEALVRLAICVDGQTGENLFLLGRVQRKQGAIEEFQKSLRQARQKGFDQHLIDAELLLAQAQSGLIEPIQSQLDALLIHGGTDDQEVLEAYTNGCLAAGRLPQAETLIDGWVKAMPKTAQPYYYRGRLLLFYGQTTAASETLRRALELEPEHYSAAYVLGTILAKENHPQEALQQFQISSKALRNAASQIQIAKTLVTLARVEEASTILHKVVDLPEEEIRISFQRVGERYEGNPGAVALGTLELAAGRYEEAYRWLDQGVRANPGDLSARHSRGLALRGLGKTEEALAELNAVSEARQALREVDQLADRVEDNPNLVEERVRIGELYLQYESKLTGEYWLKTALARDPENSRAHQLLADLYADKSKSDPRFEPLARFHRAKAQATGHAAPAQ